MISRLTIPITWGDGAAHVYVVAAGAKLILIDAGQDSELAWQTLTQGLRDIGRDVSEIRAVLLTHSHADHMGLANRLIAEVGATVYFHALEREAVEGHEGFWNTIFMCLTDLLLAHGVPPESVEQYIRMPRSRSDVADSDGDILKPLSPSLDAAGHYLKLLKDGDQLDFDDLRLKAIHCPGHSPGSMTYWHADSGTLFSGDHILKRVTLSPMIYFPEGDHERRTRSLPDYLASLQKVRDLPAIRMLPGHGDEFNDLAKAVDRIVHHHARRSERILRSLNGVPSTAFALLSTTFPQLLDDHLRLGMFEVIGHLDTLVDSGRVVEQNAGGRYSYRAIHQS